MNVTAAVLLLPCVAAVSAAARTVPGPKCTVGRVGGVPTFIFDGRPNSGVCYSSYDAYPPRLTVRAREFGEAGCNLYNFVVEIAGYGYSPPMWAAPDRWDFAALDARAHAVIAGNPKALIMPRIYIDAPEWWRQANPGEMMLLDNGKPSFGSKLFALSREGDYPSIASAKWLADMDHALDVVIAHIEASDYAARIVGYQLSGQKTEEWYHWSMDTDHLGDYSPPMAQAFRQWLSRRYGTDRRLQSAWHRPKVTLAAAAIPTRAERYGDRTRSFRDPATEMPVIDFERFWSDIMADTIDHFAAEVKRVTEGRKLVGAFYGYTFEFTDLGEDAGHLALGRLLRSPHIDFVMAPSSYYNRNLPGKPYFRLPVESVQLHGKVFWNDFDQVSYKFYDKLKADPNLKTWEYQMGLTKTPEEFVWMNRREVGMELAQGVQLAHFDIHGGYYDDPVILAGVRNLIGVREADLKLSHRGSDAQVLVLADEDSEHYVSFRNPLLTPLLSQQVGEMPFVAPYDTALLSDLGDLDVSRYRLVLVLDAFHLDAAQRRTIERKLERDGRTIVWFYAPGYFDEAGGDVANIARLTGISVAEDETGGGEAAWLRDGKPADREMKLPGNQSFHVSDAMATPLAVRAKDPRKVVIARRKMPGWTSIYTAAAPIPAEVMRSIAHRAGVHLFCDNPDVAVFANRNWLTVCADKRGGEARLSLRRKATVEDTATGDILCRDADRLTLPLRPKEVRLLRLREGS